MTQVPSQPSRRTLANAVRALSMDAVQQANSGHPGMPMGMADIAEVLWNGFLRHNPANPAWSNRDRFVLSNGHGSMLLYALLHLTGYDLSIEDLKQFRQLHSRTPGHPEVGHTPGVETTTGPLGQGLANAVGMALAEKALAARFNRPGFDVVDHHTYVFAGDGCLMEGISHEAASLAGTHGLGRLIVLYDDNGISIDGHVSGWFTDDTPKRFEAYGWHVVPGVDGHDPDAVQAAIEAARAVTDRPSLICCRTEIGFGAPNVAGKAKAHGAPLGDAEIAAARQRLGWPHPPFEVPEAVCQGWDARARGAQLESDWRALFDRYRQAHPELAAEFERRMSGALPGDWPTQAAEFVRDVEEQKPALASRKASQNAIEAYAPHLPELLGGSADLGESNLTAWSGSRAITAGDASGNYLNYGVREFAMSAIMNGLALHGGFLPYGGTFLTFSDYARNAVRMAALMGLRTVFVYTHDSIGVGEDGPTHQPVEHVASLRLIPNLAVWRPADAVETAVAWRAAIERHDGPTCLALSRQKLPHLPRKPADLDNIARGAYVLSDNSDGAPEVIVIATGSEVALAEAAAERVRLQGHRIRVVSMPSCDVFEAQDTAYREAVLPRAVTRRVAVEAGATAGWYRYVGLNGVVLGIDRFGVSAPGGQAMTHYEFTVEAVAQAIETCRSGAVPSPNQGNAV